MVPKIRTLLGPGNYSKPVNIVLFVNRLAIAAMMLGHGWGKLGRLFGDEQITFADPLGFGPITSLALTVFAEVFCSVLLMFGLGTRFAVIPLIILMVVAVFIIHADDPFGRKELAVLYLLVYLGIVIVGAGKYSLDHLMYSKYQR